MLDRAMLIFLGFDIHHVRVDVQSGGFSEKQRPRFGERKLPHSCLEMVIGIATYP